MAKKSKKHIGTAIIIILILIILGVFFFEKNANAPAPVDTNPTQPASNTIPITITQKDIKETNFTGTRSVIAGSGPLADAARTYIDQEVASFKETADEDVPDIKAQFGADEPAATYEIDEKATYVSGEKTDSIIIDEYQFTGGANGSSSYKVFTVSHATGKLLSLGDIISPSKQAAFTGLVKSKLLTWVPDGSDAPVVFTDQVEALTFDSFTNWSFDKNNLIIYFDKYAIGPGSLGAVAFPIPLSSIQADIAQQQQ